MREDERRPIRLLDDLGHGEGLARAGDAKQHLVLLARAETFHQLLDSAGLVAARLVAGHQLKIHGKIIAEERRLGEEANASSSAAL